MSFRIRVERSDIESASMLTDLSPFFFRLLLVLYISWGTKWGEDGYFKVADTEKNLYGLFGILAEGVVVTNARNVTAEVPDQSQDVPLPVWAIVLISIAACCCCVTLIGVWRRMREDR